MAGLDVDSVLRRIGQFGPYQIRILALFTFIFFPITYQTLIMVFVAYEPPWMCAKHSVTCLESNNSSPNSSSVESAVYSTSTKPKQLYERRCSLKRSDWKFAEYDLYEGPHETIVTEVKTRFVVTMKLMLKAEFGRESKKTCNRMSPRPYTQFQTKSFHFTTPPETKIRSGLHLISLLATSKISGRNI